MLYSDTGTYLKSGFIEFAFPDRPIGYGLFLRHTSLAESLWFSMIAQLIIVMIAVRVWLAVFYRGQLSRLWFLMICLALTLFSNVSPTASMLIPDVFFGVLLLCLMVLFSGKATKGQMWFVSILSALMLPTHSSLTVLLLAWLAIYSIHLLATRQMSVRWKSVVISLGIAAFGFLSTSYSNWAFRNEFTYSAGSHVFLMNKLKDARILQDYLDRECPEKRYEICLYRDQIDGEFIWDTEKSPLYIMGGWEATRDEYQAIVLDIYTTPRYWKNLLMNGLFNMFAQVSSFEQEPGYSQENGAPYYVIKKYLKFDEGTFHWAKQQRAGLDLGRFSTLNILALIGFLVLILFRFLGQQAPTEQKVLSRQDLMMAFYFLFANALVSALFSGVVDRYNTRVIWVFALIGIVEVVRALQERNLKLLSLTGLKNS